MLEGIVRESIGKKATKACRRDGYLIANIYGKGMDNLNVAFKENEFIKAVRSKESLIFEVSIDGNTIPVMIQEYQKHPVINKILHVDLRVAKAGMVGRYLVPVKTTGAPKGLKDKGVLVISKKRLLVKCDAADLPNEFMLDVSDLDVKDSILVRDIEVPANVTMMDTDRVSVVGLIKAK